MFLRDVFYLLIEEIKDEGGLQVMGYNNGRLICRRSNNEAL